jgi:hypothetical protein
VKWIDEMTRVNLGAADSARKTTTFLQRATEVLETRKKSGHAWFRELALHKRYAMEVILAKL